jgi:hypothetical protein
MCWKTLAYEAADNLENNNNNNNNNNNKKNKKCPLQTSEM